MGEIAARIDSRAHLGAGGAGWQSNGVAFSNASGLLGLSSNAVTNYMVVEDGGAPRTHVTILPNGFVFLNSTTGINPFSPGTTPLFTVPAGLRFQCKSLFVRSVASSGVSVPCRAGAGIGGGAEVYQDQSLAGLTSAGLVYRFPTGGGSRILVASEVFGFTVSLPPTGTSQTLQVEAYGRLFE